MPTHIADMQRTPGQGLDADPRNDPTYPMRDRSRADGPGMAWVRPSLQPPSVEVLQSIEHNRRPAAFGTSTPPSGLSGVFRRAAFRYSESQWGHWLLLLLADRINVVEGVLADLSHGRVPNFLAERGIRSELQHNRPAFIRRSITVAAVSLAVIAATYALTRPRRPASLYRRLRGR